MAKFSGPGIPSYPRRDGVRTKGRRHKVQRDKNIFQIQENVRQAINKALTATVPENFRMAGRDVGPLVYTPTDDPRAILIGLHGRYGTLKPEEKERAGLK